MFNLGDKMLKDKLVEFSRSQDVLYAIDAKSGSGRLLSPIQGKLTLLDQDSTASTFEEKMGYLKNSGIDIENSEWTPSATRGRIFTPIDLRGRNTSFSIICKGTLEASTTVYGTLYAQGSASSMLTTSVMLVVVSTTLYYGFTAKLSDGTYARNEGTLSLLTYPELLGEEHLFVIVYDFESSITKLYIDGNLLASRGFVANTIAVSDFPQDTGDESLNLFGGKTNYDSGSKISYFAMVDRAMSMKEIEAL